MSPAEIKALIRTITDFPAPGIRFRDITPLIADGAGFQAAVSRLAERAAHAAPDAVAGIEARGFIFGAALAARLGLGFIALRKPGKLPMPTIGLDYALEYGHARIELDPGAIAPGQRVLLIDDLLATGGTAVAAAELLRRAGAVVEQALFVVNLSDLGGAQALQAAGVAVEALVSFDETDSA